jgi:acetyl-CoA C-acetyltransferase
VAYRLNDSPGLVITLLYELRGRKKKYGLATACIGGGQGIAMVVESFQ